MLSKTLKIASGTLLAIVIQANAAPQNSEPSVAEHAWEVGIGAAGFIEGSNNDDLQSTAAYALRTNYRFKPAWSVTGEYMFSSNGNYRNKDDRTDIHRILAGLNWDAWPDDHYTPYVALAGGYEEFSGDSANRNGMLVAFGGGIRYIFTHNFGVNAEAKYKWNLDHRDVNVLLTVGLNYRFTASE